MKKLIMMVALLSSFQVTANSSTIVLECVDIEDGETNFIVKDQYAYDGETINQFRRTPTADVDDSSFYAIFEQEHKLRTKVKTNGFMIKTTERRYFDTDGNTGIPSNIYKEYAQTFKYDSLTKTASEISISYRKTIFRKIETGRDVFNYSNCIEHYEGSPDLSF